MNAIDQRTDASHDELDQTLRAFYRSEMPHPWPALQLPVVSETPLSLPHARRQRRPLWNSRFALAASIALLLLGSLLLSGAFRGSTTRTNGADSRHDTAKPVITLPRTQP